MLIRLQCLVDTKITTKIQEMYKIFHLESWLVNLTCHLESLWVNILVSFHFISSLLTLEHVVGLFFVIKKVDEAITMDFFFGFNDRRQIVELNWVIEVKRNEQRKR